MHGLCGGDVKHVQTLWRTGFMSLASAFAWACAVGNLEVAAWVLATGSADVSACDREAACVDACQRGDLEVAKWVIRSGGGRLHAQHRAAVQHALHGGHHAVLRWLLTMGPGPLVFAPGSFECLRTWSQPRAAWMRSLRA